MFSQISGSKLLVVTLQLKLEVISHGDSKIKNLYNLVMLMSKLKREILYVL
jgi:hypothetical protein